MSKVTYGLKCGDRFRLASDLPIVYIVIAWDIEYSTKCCVVKCNGNPPVRYPVKYEVVYRDVELLVEMEKLESLTIEEALTHEYHYIRARAELIGRGVETFL